MRALIAKAGASDRSGRTKKRRWAISAILALQKAISKPLLAHAIVILVTALVDQLERYFTQIQMHSDINQCVESFLRLYSEENIHTIMSWYHGSLQ